ncbi:MAG TPA: DUF502 domain-containing protein [Chlamydiales bacterium]|nr:DUF502 domain-containing protein [Chlamydiales bacterium]
MKKYFLTGLVTLLPLAVTIWILHFIVRFLTKPFIGIVETLLDEWTIGPFGIITSEQLIDVASEILILIALFVFTLLLGFVARRYFFRKLISLGDLLLHKIPLVNKVYKTSKDIVKSLFGTGRTSFKQAVLIPFPYKGSYCVGLIAREAPKTCSDAMKDELISVFIPATPNPATGFLVMCPRSELIFLDMRSEEAIKYVVSCGVIQPERIR